MSKDTNFISEIGKYFNGNDATSALNKIMDIIRTLNLSENRLFGEESRFNCKTIIADKREELVKEHPFVYNE